MKIAIDLDFTITASRQSIAFFNALSSALIQAHEIIILTNRESGTEQEVKAELDKLGMSFSRIVITANKAEYILKNGIEVFFEDTDEYFLGLPETVLVFKVREAGNFIFGNESKWIGSRKTVRLIDE